MTPITRAYDYRGRTFTITIARFPVGYGADLAERVPAGADLPLEFMGGFHRKRADALVEATQAIRALVDAEDGIPY